ncbi:MAG: putative Ig domain-containing protein [bacterium]
MVDDKNTRAAARLDEMGIGAFPTTSFDGRYGEVVGGYPDTAVYTGEILSTGPRDVTTEILDLSVSMSWLGGQGGPDDDIEITVSITVMPGLTFAYPDGVPELILPGQETTFGVDVIGSGIGVPVSGTGQLHYSINGGSVVTVDMSESMPNEYEAVLPAINCDDYMDFYFSAQEQTVGVMYDHETSPFHAYPINEIDTLYFDDFEGAFDWTVSGGQWAQGAPTGGGGQYGNPDPSSSYSGSSELGYNLNGDYGPNLPQHHVTSPAIDCSGIYNIELSFQRWLGVESPSYDHAYLRISNDGTSWTTIWENDAEVTDASWTEQAYDISSYADDQRSVYVRFTMGVTDGSWQFCGWNIDDVALIGYNCTQGFAIVTESLPDWTEGHPYSQTLSCVFPNGTVVWTDRDGDLAGTGLSLSSDGLVSGTPSVAGPVSFTAVVTDETPDTVEKAFTFVINPPVVITTTAMPEATVDEPYSSVILSTGGTGEVEWTEIGSGLSGTGLTLSADGTIEGTVGSPQTINFTVAATDQVGAFDESALTIQANPAYLCGDVDGNGVGPNIEDLVYLVNYMFNGGPPPPVMAATDVDGNGEGPNIADLVYLVSYMFSGGPDLLCDGLLATPEATTTTSVDLR